MSNIVESVESALKSAEEAVAAEAKKVEGEAVKTEHTVVAEAEKVAGEAKADVSKGVEAAKAALFAYAAALKDEADKIAVIHELEVAVERLRHPVDPATLAAEAEAKKAETEAKEDALAVAGLAARAWHRFWAWL